MRGTLLRWEVGKGILLLRGEVIREFYFDRGLGKFESCVPPWMVNFTGIALTNFRFFKSKYSFSNYLVSVL